MPASPEIFQTVACLLRSGDREAKHALRGDCDLLFAGVGGNTGPGGRARSSANRRAFASSCQGSNQSSGSSSAANLGDVTLGVALAFAAYTGAIHSLAIDGDQAQGQLTRLVQASAAVDVRDFAFHLIAGVGHNLSSRVDVTGQGSAPGLLFVGGGRTQ